MTEQDLSSQQITDGRHRFNINEERATGDLSEKGYALSSGIVSHGKCTTSKRLVGNEMYMKGDRDALRERLIMNQETEIGEEGRFMRVVSVKTCTYKSGKYIRILFNNK